MAQPVVQSASPQVEPQNQATTILKPEVPKAPKAQLASTTIPKTPLWDIKWQKLSPVDFAKRIKEKYPVYNDMDDVELTNKVLNKYPVYKDVVTVTSEQPKEQMWFKKSLQQFATPVISFVQWISDIGQWLVWQPIEAAAKKTLQLFWVDVDQLWTDTYRWDITPILWKSWETLVWSWSRELWRIVWSAGLTAGMPFAWWFKIAGKMKNAQLIGNVIKRAIAWWAEWIASTVAYNLWTSGQAGEPVDLKVAWAIGAALWWPLSLIGSRVVTPMIDSLATKLQLSWLLNRSRLDRLTTILQQWWSEDLAKWEAKDVANWMFQRDIKWSKEQIIKKLDQIADGSMELLDQALSTSTTRHNPEWIEQIMNVLKEEYSWAISQQVKAKWSRIDELSQKLKQWGLTLQEINEIKRMVNKDLAPYTASGRVKISKEDIAAANRQLKNYIETAVEQEWTSQIPIRLLNNEYAMANWMKQAITEKLKTDMLWEILSFVSNRWSTSVFGWIVWTQVWPFDNNTTEWKLWNIILWFAFGRLAWSTQAKTAVAWLLKKLTGSQKADILDYINSWGKNVLPKATQEAAENALKVIDEPSIPTNIYDDIDDWIPPAWWTPTQAIQNTTSWMPEWFTPPAPDLPSLPTMWSVWRSA
jgi:hypothetical protein